MDSEEDSITIPTEVSLLKEKKKKKKKKRKSGDLSTEALISNTPNIFEDQDSQTPGSKKKKKKHKSGDLSTEALIPNTPNISEDKAQDSQTPGSKKKKKKLKDDKNRKRKKSQSDHEENVIKSPKRKRSISTEMAFTSSDVDSQDSLTKKSVQNAIISLDSDAGGDMSKIEVTIKSKLKTHDISDIGEESGVEQLPGAKEKKSSSKKKRRKSSISEQSVASRSGDPVRRLSFDAETEDIPLTPIGDLSNLTQKDPISASDSEGEEDSAGSDSTAVAQPLRFKTDSLTEVTSCSSWPLCLEEFQKGNKELWLIKLPAGSDNSILEGASVNWNQKKVIKTENNENDNLQSVWEMSAHRISQKQGFNLTALVPSKKDKLLHSAGRIAGQITLTRGVKVPEYVMPPTGLKQPPQIPEGLKRRHQPFGSGDGPLKTNKDDSAIDHSAHSKSAKKKKRDKKQKHSHDNLLDTSIKKKKKKRNKAEK